MLRIENVLLPSSEQWEAVIRGMRNPLNSWTRSDSTIQDLETGVFGENDLKLMTKLAGGGQPNRKFMRMLPVYVDIIAPFYWWKEMDTYMIGRVANSCSTMHTIHKKAFEIGDFSYESLMTCEEDGVVWGDHVPINILYMTIQTLNQNRRKFIETQDKRYWIQMIQLLPMSYNQRRTVFLNYEVLRQIYEWRRDHKLVEWHTMCEWIEGLPLAKELIMTNRGDA